MTSPLTALVNIISSNVQSLEGAYAKAETPFPSLDDPFRPTLLDFDPSLAETRNLIVAAAAQLLATVRSPIEMLQDYAPGMYWTATLGFVVDVNVPDILKDAGPQGLHVKEISAINGIDPSYLSRILRFLATRHVFKEVTPDVFANNRLSSLLQKTKSVEEIKADPVGRFDGAPLASFISAFADESLKSCAHFSDMLQNPSKAAAAFNIALNTEAKMWDWYEEPGNEWRARRFTAAMTGGADRFPSEIFTNGIGGKDLQEGDVVVDVGGSVGSAVLPMYKAFPHLKFVVQDLAKQVIAAEGFWKEHAPEAVPSGRVKLQAHDFFTPQPVKGAAVYFLRVVIHDWPDHDAKKILQHLRDAAAPSSKLVIFDSLAVHTCEDPSANPATVQKAPYPLLANLGIAGAGFNTSLDIQMMNVFNGKERTEKDFKELGNATGWKFESLTPGLLPTFTFSAA
ncbi:4-O-methyltransferase 1 [Hypsizygus marmoreus]|uniref:4-O-methyltransferase 1 n=1 Tax=Hypsizygus marmoreus TaxID=39966 RepID=A0A369JP84_HYPMA|nr:4-O-methyltransferase 1 [Hypsizygus marmoreus]